MPEVELERIGPYTIIDLVSKSSTSSFYLSKRGKKDVTIKRLNVPLSSPEAKEAFQKRATQLKKLKHRSILDTQTFDFDGDLGYLVLERREGETLRHYFASDTLHLPADIRPILSPIADALQYAHIQNTLHTNLHPGSLSVDARKNPFITEFSLSTPEMTLDDEAFAVPYMAPEHLQGLPIAASDQYALAVMVYEWLCGRRPFEATERDLLLEQQAKTTFPVPSSINTAISPLVERVLTQALAYKPEDRFPTVQAFADAYLKALLGVAFKPSPATTKIAVTSIISNQDTRKTDIQSSLKQIVSIPTNTFLSIDEHQKQNIRESSEKITTELSSTNDLLNQRYKIIEEVGSGGFSTVYKGKDTKFEKRFVAIKKLSTKSLLNEKQKAENIEAFKHEADMLATLDHFNLPRVYDYFSEGDYWYIVMEFIEGETLEKYLNNKKDGVLDLIEVINIGIAMCSILVYLHSQKPPIIFRDIKPDNIIIKPNGQPILIDFGIARYFKLGQTKDTTALGTLGYAAPEQFNQQTTAKSDIFSLGATLHYVLSRQNPLPSFRFETLDGNATQIPIELNDLIMQMVKKEPNNRPSSTVAEKQLRQILSSLSNSPSVTNISFQKLVLPSSENNIHSAPTESLTGEALDSDRIAQVKDKLIKSKKSTDNSRLQSIVSADLRQGGILSERLPGYEERPAQVEMAMVVARALNENIPAIIEAGTGTGKSLSYLVPAVRSGKVAIISTANKALQEQLFYKDIPFVQKHIKDFGAALVKGVGNYVCIDRLENERTGMQYYAKNADFKRLVDITNDPDSDFMGDFETLGFQLPNDIRSKVATDSDQCAWSKCGYYSDCYVRQMREQAALAQIIVVNHTLLLLDAAIGGFLLPERDVIILDEAHHLEEEATRSFTITIGPTQIQTLLNQRTLRNHSQLSLQHDAMEQSTHTWERLAQVANPGFKGRINLEAPLEEGLKLATVISDLADSLRKQRPKDLPDKEGQLYDKLLKRTQNLGENIRTVFSVAQPTKFVYYVERVQTSGQRGGIQLQVSAAPLDVTGWLQEKLFKKCNVICTSATLATIGPNPMHPEEKGPNFGYFRKRVGLEQTDEPDEILERILPLAFDYESNALLYMPRDLPEPTYGAGSDDYMKAIAREMYKLVKASHGRAFLLFSSKRMLERAYELMSPHLEYPLLKQGDMTRLELTRRFREEEGSVLFGLKSFWEGVDIAGEALSLVVIDKLPFDPPDDPVHEARVAQMKAAGENWFGTYVLPQAVLRLKQGLGRLLRTREDRGVMAILDTRLHTKGYGKMVLNALPPARRTSSIRDVEHFFTE